MLIGQVRITRPPLGGPCWSMNWVKGWGPFKCGSLGAEAGGTRDRGDLGGPVKVGRESNHIRIPPKKVRVRGFPSKTKVLL